VNAPLRGRNQDRPDRPKPHTFPAGFSRHSSEPVVGQAILPADQRSSWPSRLERRLGHDWPPHEEKYAVPGGAACPTLERVFQTQLHLPHAG